MTKLLMKRGTSTPDTNDLDVGEIGINTAAGKMYFRADNNAIIEATGANYNIPTGDEIIFGDLNQARISFEGGSTQAFLFNCLGSNADIEFKYVSGSTARTAMLLDAGNRHASFDNTVSAHSYTGNSSTSSGPLVYKNSTNNASYFGGMASNQASGSIFVFDGPSAFNAQLDMRFYFGNAIVHNGQKSGIVMGNNYIYPASSFYQGYADGSGNQDLGGYYYKWDNFYADGLYIAENFSQPRAAYASRGWAVVNQTSTQAIIEDEGITSITDAGVGRTTFTFTGAMPDTNYCVVATCGTTQSYYEINAHVILPTTTTVQIVCTDINTGNQTDVPRLNMVVHR